MGLGRYAASEADVYLASVAALPGGVRGIIYCHGSNGTATSCRDYANIGNLHLANALAEVFPVLAVDAGGTQNWGNSTAMARMSDAVTYLQGTLAAKSGTVLLVGISMGAITALNYAKANPSKVAAVVGVIPAIDLNDFVVNNRAGLASVINTAYGGTYNNATQGSTYNPAVYASTFATPTRLFYASDDAIAIPGATIAFASAASRATAVSLGTGGHAESTIDAAPRDQIISFLRRYA